MAKGLRVLVLAGLMASGCAWWRAEKPRADVRLVPEMEGITEIEDVPVCPPDAFADDAAKARLAWARVRPAVEKQVNPAVARRLSRWARREMERYTAMTPLARVELRPVRGDEGRLVLEGTVDTLPSHSPVVTRWLKVFLVYDRRSQSIRQVVVTIRGRLEE